MCPEPCRRASGDTSLARPATSNAVDKDSDLDSKSIWERLCAAFPGRARGSVHIVDGLSSRIHPCSSRDPRCKSVLVAWSLEWFTRHTQTLNLYAPLTLPFGQAHGRYCRQA